MIVMNCSIRYKINMNYTSTSTNLRGKSFFWFGFILIAIGVSRYIPIDHSSLFNFSPTQAIFLVAGAFLRSKYAFIVPIVGVILTDLILNRNYGENLLEPFMLVTIGSYFLIFIFGKKLGNQYSISKILGAGIASAITFSHHNLFFFMDSQPCLHEVIFWLGTMSFCRRSRICSILFIFA